MINGTSRNSVLLSCLLVLRKPIQGAFLIRFLAFFAPTAFGGSRLFFYTYM